MKLVRLPFCVLLLQNNFKFHCFQLTAVQRAGVHLTDALWDPSEKKDVQHAIEEVERASDDAQKRWEERKALLSAQDEQVKAFEAALADFKEWMHQQEDRLGALPPVAMESGRVKQQLEETKGFKADLEPKQLDVEALNQRGYELARDSSAEQKNTVQDKLFDLNEKWDDLLDSVNERQVKTMRYLNDFRYVLMLQILSTFIT